MNASANPLQAANHLIEKVARMAAYEVPNEQIAAAVGLNLEQLAQVFATDEYQNWMTKLANEDFEKQQTINEGWDSVEELAVTRVLEYMATDPDPDYALKAAVVANKASRRGGQHSNAPVHGDLGARAVLHLHANFVAQLQQNFNVPVESTHEPLQLQRKESNFLSAKGVQNLLRPREKEVEADLDGFATA